MTVWVSALPLALAIASTALAAQGSEGGRLFVAANALYAQQRWAEAAAAYESVLAVDPSLGEAHFFLASAQDSQYASTRRGQPDNDRLLDAARDHYVKAAALLVRPDQALLRKRSLQYLVMLYASDKLNQPDEAETVVRQLIAIEPGDTGSYFALLKIYEGAGRIADAETVLGQAQAAAPDRTEVWTQSAQFYNRRGEFDRSMAAFERLTRIEPQNPQHFYQLAVYYEEKVRKDFSLGPQQASEYLARGVAAIDKALELRPEYFEALTYKNLLLRQQARFETDPARQQVLIDAAEQLQSQAIDVRNRQTGGPRRP